RTEPRVESDAGAHERPLNHAVAAEEQEADLQPGEHRQSKVEEQRYPQRRVDDHPRPVALHLPDQERRRDHRRERTAPFPARIGPRLATIPPRSRPRTLPPRRHWRQGCVRTTPASPASRPPPVVVATSEGQAAFRNPPS